MAERPWKFESSRPHHPVHKSRLNESPLRRDSLFPRSSAGFLDGAPWSEVKRLAIRHLRARKNGPRLRRPISDPSRISGQAEQPSLFGPCHREIDREQCVMRQGGRLTAFHYGGHDIRGKETYRQELGETFPASAIFGSNLLKRLRAPASGGEAGLPVVRSHRHRKRRPVCAADQCYAEDQRSPTREHAAHGGHRTEP